MFIHKEFKPLAPPTYRPAVNGEWSISIAPRDTRRVLAYFRNGVPMPAENWHLKKGSTVWMSLTPMELESQGYHARMATGNVVVAGLGMGALVYNLLANPKVKHVTVVDINQAVVDLLKLAAPWFAVGPRLDVVVMDALKYVPTHPVDTLIVDIWPNLGQEEAERDTKAMQANVQAKVVGWWGQELDLVSWLSIQGFAPPITLDNIAAYQKHLGFKLMAANHHLWPSLALAAASGLVLATMSRPRR